MSLCYKAAQTQLKRDTDRRDTRVSDVLVVSAASHFPVSQFARSLLRVSQLCILCTKRLNKNRLANQEATETITAGGERGSLEVKKEGGVIKWFWHYKTNII